MSEPIISCIIPTYLEEDFIVNTINSLAAQTVWPMTEIVIADYDSTGERKTISAIMYGCSPFLKHINFVNVDKAGIGYARHLGAMAARGRYLVCYDADCHFARSNDLDTLVRGLSDTAKVTHCNSIIQPEDLNNVEAQKFNMLYTARNFLLKVTKLPICFEQGLTMEKETYIRAGGFKDVKILEGPTLCATIGMIYGMDSLVFQPDVFILTSARRGVGSDGILFDTNYEHAYRGSGPVKVT